MGSHEELQRCEATRWSRKELASGSGIQTKSCSIKALVLNEHDNLAVTTINPFRETLAMHMDSTGVLPLCCNTCQNGLLPALMRPSLPSIQAALGMKQFLPFPLETASAVSLFPGFNTSQALAHYKGTKHAKKLKALDSPKTKLKGSLVLKDTTMQELVQGITTSQVSSITDSKDIVPDAVALPLSPVLRTAQLMATPMMLPPAPPPVALPIVPIRAAAASAPESTSSAGGDEQQLDLNSPSEPDLEPEAEPEPEAEADPESEQEKAQRLLYCSLCKVAVNSASQLEAHNSGTKHKTMLEARSGVGSIKSFPRPGVKSKVATVTKSATGLQNKTFHCETCDVHVNSETQLKQHISSRRHKDRAAGKPAKPKYSPYSKPQKGLTKQPITLTLGKEHQCQPLSAQMLPAHLAAVAAAISNAFTHRTNHASSLAPPPSLFQTQPLPAALLRPAPGPVRTSHPQILFAPY
ncbi:zinc finger protein 385D [Pleuronectes platessa]|uniref:zinc finger protein 385D n=1 Tax=Pleuronectes platessa TaxID=8262 RepID=UPI00232A74B2|nr:zinc finger protein 385D [Pleuronectes platessa]